VSIGRLARVCRQISLTDVHRCLRYICQFSTCPVALARVTRRPRRVLPVGIAGGEAEGSVAEARRASWIAQEYVAAASHEALDAYDDARRPKSAWERADTLAIRDVRCAASWLDVPVLVHDERRRSSWIAPADGDVRAQWKVAPSTLGINDSRNWVTAADTAASEAGADEARGAWR
jgi:hypothetical protein